MLGELGEKVKNFLHVLRTKGGAINTVMTVAAAKAFIARSQNKHLKCIIGLHSSYWAKKLFRRLGFTKRACTTSKPKIPELARKGGKAIFSTSNRSS